MEQKNYFSIVRATLLALLVTFGFQRLNAQVSYDANVETYDFTGYGYNASITRGDGDVLQKIAGTEIKSQYTGEYRFVIPCNNGNNWYVGVYGSGLASYRTRDFTILNLHSGDKVKIEYQRENDNTDPFIKLQSADFLAKSVNNAPETETYQEEVIGDDGSVSYVTNTRVKTLPVDYEIHGYEEYFCVANGSLIVNVYQHTSIKKITIWSWNYADYEIVPVSSTYGNGNTFRFTSAGLHVDKHAAVPFMTMQFGSDDYKTIVSNYNNHFCSVSLNHDNNTHVYFSGSGGNMMPSEGSFYYFYPEADGKLIVKGYIETVTNRKSMTFIEKKLDNTNGDINWFDGPGETTMEIDVVKGRKYFISPNPLEFGPNPTTSQLQELPVFHLYEYSFYPSGVYDGPLGMVAPNGSTEYTYDVTGDHSLRSVSLYSDTYHTGYLGNIQSATLSVENGKLKISNVTFKSGDDVNKGGAILVRANPNNTGGQDAIIVATIAYSAEQYGGDKEIKKWDFYSKSLALGKYSDGSSQLRYETDKTPTDWQDVYLNLYTNTERVFKSVYDMEGDNAHMIAETEGLYIDSKTNEVCIFNENPVDGSTFQDRFVGLFPGAKVTIPKLQAGDHVRILMNRYAGVTETDVSAILSITNGWDVDLTPKRITEPYKFGGTTSRISGGNCVLYGDYNFIVGDQDGINSNKTLDFSFEMTGGKLIKLYSIEIYKNKKNNTSELVSTNNILRQTAGANSLNEYEVVYKVGDTPKKMSYALHNHGKGERTKILKVDNVRGNLFDLSASNLLPTAFAMEDDEIKASYTPAAGSFGSFNLCLGTQTLDKKYITDRAERSMAIGYIQQVKYPYTWDFTKLEEYPQINNFSAFVNGAPAIQESDYAEKTNERYIENAVRFEKDASNLQEKGWVVSSDGYAMRTGTEENNGILFADGGQLYGSSVMFDETAGIGFKRSHNKYDFAKIKKLNEGLRITSTSLVLDCNEEDIFYKLVIPQVKANAVIYVVAQTLRNNNPYFKTLVSKDGANSQNFDVTLSNTGKDKYDKTYIIKNDAERDVELWLNGLAIKKIGISEDPKKIGKTGFVSESRDHKIDHSLTAEFTGLPIQAYIVTGIDDEADAAGNRGVEVREVGVLQENQGCFIANDMEAAYQENENKSVNILGDGYTHLFVPAIHDMHESTNFTNYMQPMINGGTIQQNSNGKINYALSSKHYSPSNPSQVVYGQVGFYRADKNKGATIPKNGAYLAVEEPVANNANAFYLRLEGTEEPLAEDFGDQDITAVKGIENAAAFEGDWYNMNGQKLNGRPNASGIYVVNGKKVVIK